MSRIISCVGPEVLSALMKSELTKNLSFFRNFDDSTAVFDAVWSDDQSFDLVLIEDPNLDFEDLSVAAINSPNTQFIIYGFADAIALKMPNLACADSIESLKEIFRQQAAAKPSH